MVVDGSDLNVYGFELSLELLLLELLLLDPYVLASDLVLKLEFGVELDPSRGFQKLGSLFFFSQ